MSKKPTGWQKDPARHALAARGVKTKPIHSRMADLGLKRSGGAWGRGDQPIMTLSTNPSLEDVFGDMAEQFDFLMETYPDLMKALALEKGVLVEDIKTKEEKEKFAADFYWKHNEWFQDEARRFWDDEVDYFSQIVHAAGFNDGDWIIVEASPADWRGHSGSRSFQWNGKPDGFVTETFGSLGNDFIARVNRVGKNRIEVVVSTHDIPTGSRMTIQKGDVDVER